MSLRVIGITVGPFQENCYLVHCDETGEGYVVDPGDEAERILEVIRETGMKPKAVINTHAHLDHVGAVSEICEALDLRFHLHADDQFLLEGLPDQAAMFGLPAPRVPAVDEVIVAGAVYSVGPHELEVLHTPGHSPGSVCFYDGKETLLGGDVLFAGSIGRTDLPRGSFAQLERSIREKIYVLPDPVVIFPGHGPATTVGREKTSNPFVHI